MDHQRKRGMLVLIVGPSAGGKTTIVDEAIRRLPSAARLVTTTTRPRRPAEHHGVHYHFLDRAEFEKRLAAGEFLEHNEFDGHLYGSSREVLELLLQEHDVVLAILDVNGARAALRAFPDARSVFLRPESMDDLRRRHEARGRTPEEVAWRLERASEELAVADEFDVVLMNREGHVDDTVDALLALIGQPGTAPRS